APPDLTATATPTSGDAPLDVDFSASATDPEGTDVSLVWDFGDGSPTVTTGETSHTYTDPGTYQARVTATDEDGRTSARSFSIRATEDCDTWAEGPDDDFDGDALD